MLLGSIEISQVEEREGDLFRLAIAANRDHDVEIFRRTRSRPHRNRHPSDQGPGEPENSEIGNKAGESAVEAAHPKMRRVRTAPPASPRSAPGRSCSQSMSR